MKILSTVKRIPGGMMVVPLLLGATINTFFPQFFELGGFTEALFKTGATAILAAFLFANGAQISVKQAGKPLYKGTALLISKLLLGGLLGVLVNALFGPMGLLGITPLAIIAALTNSNGGLFAALGGQYGDATDVGVVSIIALNDGPFLTMLVLGATGLASVPFTALIATLVPILIGFILGNLDDDIRVFLKPATSILIPFFAFPLGAGLNFSQLITAGFSGVLLGVITTVVTGFGGYYTYKLIKADHPYVGAAIGTTAGNAVGTPAALAAIDPSISEIAGIATAQVAAAIIVTAILTPLLVSWLYKNHKAKAEGATS
ncbi:2-keto-3-deoxygluconate permease [Marinilactibacillus piezotolerans]|uniref:2-keto-3-deoxygluconate permease n=1 Tax=Marinilactibacillus piezotolerans TaxID=258723 RepID=A0A1I4C1G5_9LACT|nr:2-keto-3-deoxygluconate permease [Marinilactibacillus piezotolerans]SFK74918.1 2-keto-3-deoxygluconate permease [Marinilactibacillus piezotolerans]